MGPGWISESGVSWQGEKEEEGELLVPWAQPRCSTCTVRVAICLLPHGRCWRDDHQQLQCHTCHCLAATRDGLASGPWPSLKGNALSTVLLTVLLSKAALTWRTSTCLFPLAQLCAQHLDSHSLEDFNALFKWDGEPFPEPSQILSLKQNEGF